LSRIFDQKISTYRVPGIATGAEIRSSKKIDENLDPGRIYILLEKM
jgi:hypothetical protein